jgi:hypothetical protein
MPPLTADKLINKEIFAGEKTVKGYNASGRSIKTFAPGQLLGVVYSWLNLSSLKTPVLMFYEDARNFKNPYYIKINDGPFKATAEIKKIIDAEKIADEKEKITSKGPFAYYIEKYGPYILGTIIIIAIIKKKL